jgi:hypothetical protein
MTYMSVGIYAELLVGYTNFWRKILFFFSYWSRTDPKLFRDDVDIKFSRSLNSCKVPQVGPRCRFTSIADGFHSVLFYAVIFAKWVKHRALCSFIIIFRTPVVPLLYFKYLPYVLCFHFCVHCSSCLWNGIFSYQNDGRKNHGGFPYIMQAHWIPVSWDEWSRIWSTQ